MDRDSRAETNKVYARADIPVAELIRHRLKAFRDNDPFERHTCVVGWPNSSDPDERKALLKQITLEISQCSDVMLVIPAEPITMSIGP